MAVVEAISGPDGVLANRFRLIMAPEQYYTPCMRITVVDKRTNQSKSMITTQVSITDSVLGSCIASLTRELRRELNATTRQK